MATTSKKKKKKKNGDKVDAGVFYCLREWVRESKDKEKLWPHQREKVMILFQRGSL